MMTRTKEPTRASDVAARIITDALAVYSPVTNLQLQKLVFLCQCAHLRATDHVMFEDDIIAWQYGPVVQSLFYTYAYRGASSLRRVVNNKSFPIQELDDASVDTVRRILDAWLEQPLWNLVAHTCKEGGAWDVTYNPGGLKGTGFGDTIPVRLMRTESPFPETR
jgi:uncharacterized phage-associated protein